MYALVTLWMYSGIVHTSQINSPSPSSPHRVNNHTVTGFVDGVIVVWDILSGQNQTCTI